MTPALKQIGNVRKYLILQFTSDYLKFSCFKIVKSDFIAIHMCIVHNNI